MRPLPSRTHPKNHTPVVYTEELTHLGGRDLQPSSHADADAEVCLKLWKKRENSHCETGLASLHALAAHKITNLVDRIASKYNFSASCWTEAHTHLPRQSA